MFFTAPKTCSSDELMCGQILGQSTGHCIPQHWACDKETDCEDGSDESKAQCGKISWINGNMQHTSYMPYLTL